MQTHVQPLGTGYSFASGGIPNKPPGYQFILWDTNAKINGLVAEDLETLVSQVLSDFPYNTGFADRLVVITNATDHKNNVNRSDPIRKVPQMRPQHHIQPLTNPPGHAQEPHERYRCKTTTKPTAATHQPPATETALEGAQEPSKTLGSGASAR
jgi:hypothetical protein